MRVTHDGREVDPGPRQQALVLAMLLGLHDQPVTMGQLIDAVWGETAPAHAMNVIHKYVGTLRRVLEPHLPIRNAGTIILRRGSGYVCSLGPETLDLAQFREALSRARTLDSGGDSAALGAYINALSLWSGPAGDAIFGSLAGAALFDSINAEFVSACKSAAELAIAVGEPERALPFLRIACAIDPLHESVVAGLMLALDATGERAEALAVFDTTRHRLADELGIDPGQHLQSAYRRILDPDTARAAGDDSARGLADRIVAIEPFRVADFSGRPAELRELKEFVDTAAGASRPVVMLVTGPPGVGKTTTTLEALHAIDPALRLFVNLHAFGAHPLSPLQVLTSLLAQVNPGELPPGTLDDAVTAWKASARDRGLTVVLDNAGAEAQIRPVLAVEGPVTVIITSRSSLSGLENAHRVALGPLAREESVELLSAIIPEAQRDAALLDELGRLCGDFPLALRIAGARVASRPAWSVADFVERLSDRNARLQQLVAGDLAVEAAFRVSFDGLHPSARRLFRNLSLLYDTVFGAPMAAIVDGLDPRECRDQLDALADLGLLEAVRGDRYRIHDLLRLYAEDRLRNETIGEERVEQRMRLDRWILDATVNAARAFPSGWALTPEPPGPTAELEAARLWLTTESTSWYSALKSSVDRGQHQQVVDTAMALTAIADEWGQWGQWAEFHALGAASAEALGDRDAVAALRVGAASGSEYETEDPAEFESIARQAFAAAEDADNPRWIAWSRLFIASSRQMQDDLDTARAEMEQAVTEFAEIGDVSSELEARARVVRILTQVDPDSALLQAEAAVDLIDRHAPDPWKHVHGVAMINVYNAVARLYMDAEHFENVLEVTDRMLEIPEPFLNPGAYAARALRHRGLALAELGRPDEAAVALQSALESAGSYRPDWWATEIEETLESIARG